MSNAGAKMNKKKEDYRYTYSGHHNHELIYRIQGKLPQRCMWRPEKLNKETKISGQNFVSGDRQHGFK